MDSSNWAKTQLAKLLPLDDDSLQQILDFTSGLSNEAAAEHLKNLLGDSPKSLEFISSYNSQRNVAVSDSTSVAQPTPAPKTQYRKKGRAPLNQLPPPRQVDSHGDTTGAYQKSKEEDYMAGKAHAAKRNDPSLSNTLALSDTPEVQQLPKVTQSASLKPPPSAAGPLISDLPNVRSGSRNASRNASRNSSPAPKTTINISGGASMHGASTTLQDLDSAIRSLEIQTNPTLSSDTSSSIRACPCNASRHPLLAAAPNCLSCGKVICVKEGIGPCTYCGRPLLSSAEIQGMIDSLKQERGQEKMQVNNASNRRADVATTARAFANPPLPTRNTAANDKAFDLAREHRDRLLGYQAENARRTQIIDEAADYETPSSGLSKWSSPIERAAQLKRQQQILREQEWNARPEYEKRKVVVSVDLVGGKVVKRMANAERPEHHSADITAEDLTGKLGTNTTLSHENGGGNFSRNPLIGNLIRPMWTSKGKERDKHNDSGGENEENGDRPQLSKWRRVQDDEDDNEAWILDGGIYGGRDAANRILGAEEHAQG